MMMTTTATQTMCNFTDSILMRTPHIVQCVRNVRSQTTPVRLDFERTDGLRRLT